MAFEGEFRVRTRHPLTVVFDRHELLPAEIDDDGDSRGTGVHGVLDELLHDGGRTLDDLAGGNLVGARSGGRRRIRFTASASRRQTHTMTHEGRR